MSIRRRAVRRILRRGLVLLVGPCRLELQTSGVSSRRSNQLSYGPLTNRQRSGRGLFHSRFFVHRKQPDGGRCDSDSRKPRARGRMLAR